MISTNRNNNNTRYVKTTGTGVNLYNRRHDDDDDDDDDDGDQHHDDETYTIDQSENHDDDATEYSEYPETPLQLNRRTVNMIHPNTNNNSNQYQHQQHNNHTNSRYHQSPSNSNSRYQQSPSEAESEEGWSENASVTSTGNESTSYSSSPHSNSNNSHHTNDDQSGSRRGRHRNSIQNIPILDNVNEEDDDYDDDDHDHNDNETLDCTEMGDDISLGDDHLHDEVRTSGGGNIMDASVGIMDTSVNAAEKCIQYLSKIGSISHMSQHFLGDDNNSSHFTIASHSSDAIAALRKISSTSNVSSSSASSSKRSAGSNYSKKSHVLEYDDFYNDDIDMDDNGQMTSSEQLKSPHSQSQQSYTSSSSPAYDMMNTNAYNKTVTTTKALVSYIDGPKKPNRIASTLSTSQRSAGGQIRREVSTSQRSAGGSRRRNGSGVASITSQSPQNSTSSRSSKGSATSSHSNTIKKTKTISSNTNNKNHRDCTNDDHQHSHRHVLLNCDSIDMTEILDQSDNTNNIYDDNESRHNDDSRTNVILSRKITDITESLARETNRNKEKINKSHNEKERLYEYNSNNNNDIQRQQLHNNNRSMMNNTTQQIDHEHGTEQQQNNRIPQHMHVQDQIEDDDDESTIGGPQHSNNNNNEDNMPISAPGIFVPGKDEEDTRRFSHILRLANDASIAMAALSMNSKDDIAGYLDDDDDDTHNDVIIHGYKHTAVDSRDKSGSGNGGGSGLLDDDNKGQTDDDIPQSIPYFKSSSLRSLQHSKNFVNDDVSMLESGSSLYVDDLQRSQQTILYNEYQQRLTKQQNQQQSYQTLYQPPPPPRMILEGSSGGVSNSSSTRNSGGLSTIDSGGGRRGKLLRSLSFDSRYESPWVEGGKQTINLSNIGTILETPLGPSNPTVGGGDAQPVIPVRISTPGSGDGNTNGTIGIRGLQSLPQPLKQGGHKPRRHSLHMGFGNYDIESTSRRERESSKATSKASSSKKAEDAVVVVDVSAIKKSEDQSKKKNKEPSTESTMTSTTASKSKQKSTSPSQSSPDSLISRERPQYLPSKDKDTSPKESSLRQSLNSTKSIPKESPLRESLNSNRSPASISTRRQQSKRSENPRDNTPIDKTIGTTIVIPMINIKNNNNEENVDKNIGTTIIITKNNPSFRASTSGIKDKYEDGSSSNLKGNNDPPVLRLPQGHHNFAQEARFMRNMRRFSTGVNIPNGDYYSPHPRVGGDLHFNPITQNRIDTPGISVLSNELDQPTKQQQQQYHDEMLSNITSPSLISSSREKSMKLVLPQAEENFTHSGRKKASSDVSNSILNTSFVLTNSINSTTINNNKKILLNDEHKDDTLIKPPPRKISNHNRSNSSDDEEMARLSKVISKQSKKPLRTLSFNEDDTTLKRFNDEHNYDEYDDDLPHIPTRRPTKTSFFNESSVDEHIRRTDRALSTPRIKPKRRELLLGDDDSRSVDIRHFYLKHHDLDRRTIHTIAIFLGCTLFILGGFAGSLITILAYDGSNNVDTTKSTETSNLSTSNEITDGGVGSTEKGIVTQSIFNISDDAVLINATNTMSVYNHSSNNVTSNDHNLRQLKLSESLFLRGSYEGLS